MKRKYLLIVVLILAASFLLTGCAQKKAYDAAMELYSANNYAEAAEAFKELGDYKDSAALLKECNYKNATNLFNDGAYEDSRLLFIDLGDYENASDMVKACDSKIAMKLFDEGKYEEARNVFVALGDYENSAEMVKSCDLQLAMKLYDDGAYEEARSAFAALGDFENAAEMVNDCDYKTAMALFKAESYEEALAAFTDLGNYKDSKKYADDCSHKIMLEKYKDVFAALNGKTWYFNGGSNTVLNKITFNGDKANLGQVYFDGNGKHDNGTSTLTIDVDANTLIVTLKDNSKLRISYTLSGSTIKLDKSKYLTIEEVEEQLQGYWHYKSSSSFWGPTLYSETCLYINNGSITYEEANQGYNLPSNQYYYSGPYTSTYKLEFGYLKTSFTYLEGQNWYWNIINGKATPLNWDHVCTPTNKLPGRNGYKF